MMENSNARYDNETLPLIALFVRNRLLCSIFPSPLFPGLRTAPPQILVATLHRRIPRTGRFGSF